MIVVFFIILAVSVFSLILSIVLLNEYNKKTRKFHGYKNEQKKLKKHGLCKGIVAFGSARIPDTDVHIKEIEEISELCAKRIKEKNKQISFITGDGPSVMTAWLKGAKKYGAQTAGFAIKLPFEEETSGYSDYCYEFTNFPARKQTFFDFALCYVIFKGGFGTMDELYNLLCYMQNGKESKKPILVYPEDFYKNTLNFKEFIENGTIGNESMNLLKLCKTKEELLTHLYNIIDNYQN